MSGSTDDTTRDRRDQSSPAAREAAGLVRKMAITLTSGPQWKCRGYTLLDGQPEVRRMEPFANVGFFARPKDGANAEAIVAFPDGASNPVIVATRDEDVRKVVAQLNPDETAAFNSTTIILIKGSTVEIRLAGGVATKLPTLADYEALRAFVNAQFAAAAGHVHATPAGATTTITLAPAQPAFPPAATGTQVLKTQ
jgi:hypothetical protein